jgi:hypothetical protein
MGTPPRTGLPLRTLADAALIAALLLVIGWLDLVTGYDLQFFIFYFLPVALAAWRLRLVSGLLTAGLCMSIWLFADVHSGHVYSDPLFAYWNGGIRLAAFLTVAVTLARLREALRAERALRNEVENALREIKQLRGLLPICSACKRIRDDKGAWVPVEQYVRAHSEAEFTHGICPQCVSALYPEVAARLTESPPTT